MSKASYLQSAFFGGEWAPEVQGRQESDAYKTALNKCVNYYPIEQGSLLRRQGFARVGHTKGGAPGKLFDFDLDFNPLQLEFTDGWIRFIQEGAFVANGANSIASISTATPAVIETVTPHGWDDDDTVFFTLRSARVIPSTLFNRQFVITSVDDTHFSIVDALTGDEIDGSNIGWNGPLTLVSGDTYKVSRIAELPAPYINGDWAQVTTLQDDEKILLFHKKYKPLQITSSAATCFNFVISNYTFADGPYLDINSTATTLTPSGTSGSVTVTASSVNGINGGTGFQTTDVGRHIRLYLAPAAWDSTSDAYRTGDMVAYTDGNFYVALKDDNGPASNHGVAAVPTNIDHWALLGYIPTWIWLVITTVTSSTVVHATIQKSVTSDNATGFNILPTKTWRLGAFSDTTTWPALGDWHEGRLWLAGAIINRFDASMEDGSYINFAPTYDDGQVADNNGITYTVKSNEKNAIVWLSPNDSGILFGTQSSEWKLRASTLDDPMTPSSIQARRQSKYGSQSRCINVGKFNVFIQRAKRKAMEIVFGNSANEIKVTNLSLTASHLTVGGIEDIRYAKEPKPTIWGQRADGRLIGMTYIRDDETIHAGWHSHPLGHGRAVKSISVCPSLDQFSDRLYTITADDAGVYWIEMLTDVFDDSKGDQEGFFVDDGIVPGSANIATVADDGFDGVKLYGFFPFVGETLSVTLGGMDLGDFVVDADGVISLPYQTAIGYTLAFIQTLGDIVGNSVNIATTEETTVATTLPDDTGILFGYVGPDNIVHGVSNAVSYVDPERGRVIVLKEGNTSTDGIRVFNADENADEALEVSRDDILTAPVTSGDFIFSSSLGGAGMKDFDGNIYFERSGSNIFTWVKVDATTLVEVAQCDVDLNFSGAQSTAPIRSLGHDGTITNYALLWGEDHFSVVNTDTMAVLFHGLPAEFTEEFGNVCSGPMVLGAAIAYVLGTGNYDLGANSDPLGLYRFGVSDNCDGNAAQATKIASIAPADIDATWSNFSDACGLVYDQLDGNVIGMFATTDVVTNQNYIAKLNVRTGAVMWKVPTLDIDGHGIAAMNRTWLTNGTYCYMSGTTGGGSGYPVYKINTLTGSVVTDIYNGTQITGSQSFDDRTGCITWFGNFTAAGGPPPAEAGDYLTGAPSGWTSQWGRLGVIPPAGTVTPLVYPAPVVVGYTYTSQGQLLRPDHGSDAGARNGPAFGKKRRNHWFAALLNRTQTIKFGTDFGNSLKPAKLATSGGTPILQPTLYSGIHTDTIVDDYSFDGMISFQQTRPVPGQILAVAGYIEVHDK